MKLLIDHYGHESQKMMLLEEMAELQKEICKDMRYDPDLEAITEEVADVLIMICAGIRLYHECRRPPDDRVPRAAFKREDDYYDKVLKEPHGSD